MSFCWDYDDPNGNGEYRFLQSIAHRLNTAIDVGANIGDYSRKILEYAPACRVIAFEPIVELFTKLRSEGKVEAYSMAIGNSCSPVVLNINPVVTGMSSIYPRAVNSGATRVLVPQQTIDGIMQALELPDVDLLKIDTEGNEIAVLEGAKDSLADHRFAYIQFEYGGTYSDSFHTLREAFEIFDRNGYMISHLWPQGLIPCPVFDASYETFRYSNWVATRKEA